jgi:hypothetical protein
MPGTEIRQITVMATIREIGYFEALAIAIENKIKEGRCYIASIVGPRQ